jgi:hypothetical protein
VGIHPSWVENYVAEMNKIGYMCHSFMMIRHNKVFAEGYWKPFHKDWMHRMYSISKSFGGAAIGMLVVDQALFQLQSITSESELNSAMNKMGMALKQLRRLDNSTTVISGAAKKALLKWYPYPLEENEADKAFNNELVVPEDLRERVDDDFVKNMMNGDSFDLCVLKASQKNDNYVPERSANDLLMDNINDAFGAEERRHEERKAMNDRFGDQF